MSKTHHFRHLRTDRSISEGGLDFQTASWRIFADSFGPGNRFFTTTVQPHLTPVENIPVLIHPKLPYPLRIEVQGLGRVYVVQDADRMTTLLPVKEGQQIVDDVAVMIHLGEVPDALHRSSIPPDVVEHKAACLLILLHQAIKQRHAWKLRLLSIVS